jgi:hypothetical protein
VAFFCGLHNWRARKKTNVWLAFAVLMSRPPLFNLYISLATHLGKDREAWMETVFNVAVKEEELVDEEDAGYCTSDMDSDSEPLGRLYSSPGVLGSPRCFTEADNWVVVTASRIMGVACAGVKSSGALAARRAFRKYFRVTVTLQSMAKAGVVAQKLLQTGHPRLMRRGDRLALCLDHIEHAFGNIELEGKMTTREEVDEMSCIYAEFYATAQGILDDISEDPATETFPDIDLGSVENYREPCLLLKCETHSLYAD